MRKFISAVTSLVLTASMASVLVPASVAAEDTVKGLSLEAFAEADSKYSKMGSNITVSAEDIAAGDVTIPCALYIDETTPSATIGASWFVNGGADAEKITAKMYDPWASYWSEAKEYTIADGSTFSTKNYVTFTGEYDDFDESYVNTGMAGSIVAQKGQSGCNTNNYYMNYGWATYEKNYKYTGSKSTDHPVVVFDVTLPKGIAAGEYTLEFTSFNTTRTPDKVNPAPMIETTERFTEENGKLTLQNMTITVEGGSVDPGTTTTTTTTTTTKSNPGTTTTTTQPVGDADIVFDFGNYTAKPGDKVKVNVILTANGNKISGMDAVLKQDSPIKLTNIGKTSPVFEKALVINLDESSFNFQSLDSSMEAMVVEDGGTVLTLGYEVPADCPDGVYEIGFGDKCMVFRDNSAFQYKTAKVNGFITVGDAQDTTTTTTTSSTTTTTTTTTTKDPGTTTTTTTGTSSDGEYAPVWGDTDNNGTVNISDVVILNRWLHDNTSITISDQGKVNADCCDPQDPKGGKVKVSGVKLTAADSTAIIESIVHLVTLPVSSK